jgi:small subunit ribosomal protein S6
MALRHECVACGGVFHIFPVTVRFEAERNLRDFPVAPARLRPVPVSLLCLRSFNAFPRLDGGYAPDSAKKGKAAMPLYEHTFLARQDVTAQQVTGLMNTYKAVIEELGGKVEKTEYWGLKSTAYKIKKNRRAHYAFFNIDAPHTAVIEMERQMRISSDVIRFLTVRVSELDEKPSIQLRKQDERERGDRGDRGDRGPRPPRRDRDDRGFRAEGEEGGQRFGAPRGQRSGGQE